MFLRIAATIRETMLRITKYETGWIRMKARRPPSVYALGLCILKHWAVIVAMMPTIRSTMCFLVFVLQTFGDICSVISAPFRITSRFFYSTTISVFEGSPSPALLTAMMRYSSSFPFACWTNCGYFT